MANLLYFDAYSGLSGDMTLGALLHLGMPLEYLEAGLAKLAIPGFSLEKRLVEQQHISGIKLDVNLENEHEHVHRSVTDIEKIISESELPARVKERAIAVFWRLAKVEGQIHNMPPDQVHFHEVGAVDAIVDIVGSCIGFEYFDVTEFYCSPLPVGSGFVRAAHGLMPVPAPATLELLAQAGAALAPTVVLSNGAEYPARSEMITPTGAALVVALCKHGMGNRPSMTLKGTGYGFGSKEFAWPNALRLWLGNTIANPAASPEAVAASLENQTQAHSHADGQPHTHAHDDNHSHTHSHAGEHDHSHEEVLYQSHEEGHPLTHSHEEGGHSHPHNHGQVGHSNKSNGKSNPANAFDNGHLQSENQPRHNHPVKEGASQTGPEIVDGQETFYGHGEVSLIETNLDDMTAEGLGYLMERLLAAKALDVYFTPILMKKNRPATKLSVVAHPQDEARLAALIIKESSTFGVRCYRMGRYTTGRQFRQVAVAGGSAQVKLKIVNGTIVDAVPEYDSVAALARNSGRPWREVYEEVRRAARDFVVIN
jgi:uncharacterized protein (DUF111 family)